MTYSHLLESPVSSEYYLHFIIGNITYKEVKKSIENHFDKKIKMSNLTKVVISLVKKGYLLVADDGSSTKYRRKQFNIKRDRIVKDMYKTLIKDIPEKYTYSFEFKTGVSKNEITFSYLEDCKKFKLDLEKNPEFEKFIFNLFKEYCKMVSYSIGKKTIITNTTYEFNYFNIILNFILGFSIPESYVSDNYKYVMGEKLLGYLEEPSIINKDILNEYENFVKLCKMYPTIKQVNEISILSMVTKDRYTNKEVKT